jgi:hypothetical protein
VTRLSEERAQELIALASELVMRVREVDPERNGTWLEAHRADWRDLLIVLAAMVDPSTPLPVVLAWTWPLADRDE